MLYYTLPRKNALDFLWTVSGQRTYFRKTDNRIRKTDCRKTDTILSSVFCPQRLLYNIVIWRQLLLPMDVSGVRKLSFKDSVELNQSSQDIVAEMWRTRLMKKFVMDKPDMLSL